MEDLYKALNEIFGDKKSKEELFNIMSEEFRKTMIRKNASPLDMVNYINNKLIFPSPNSISGVMLTTFVTSVVIVPVSYTHLTLPTN